MPASCILVFNSLSNEWVVRPFGTEHKLFGFDTLVIIACLYLKN